jgi:hypothetical protein
VTLLQVSSRAADAFNSSTKHMLVTINFCLLITKTEMEYIIFFKVIDKVSINRILQSSMWIFGLIENEKKRTHENISNFDWF